MSHKNTLNGSSFRNLLNKPFFWISLHTIIILSIFYILHINSVPDQADFITIHDFFQTGSYSENPFYFYLPVFWIFSPLYIDYNVLIGMYVLLLVVNLYLLKRINIPWIEKEIIVVFMLITFYLDVERGNSNYFILTLVLISLLLLEKWKQTENKQYLYLTILPFVIASFKANFVLIVGFLLIYLWIEKGFKQALVYGSIYALIMVGTLIPFLIDLSQLQAFIQNVSNKNIGITINFIFEMNQLAWFFLAIIWLLFNANRPEKTQTKRIIIIGAIIGVFILKIIGILIHKFQYNGSWM